MRPRVFLGAGLDGRPDVELRAQRREVAFVEAEEGRVGRAGADLLLKDAVEDGVQSRVAAGLGEGTA